MSGDGSRERTHTMNTTITCTVTEVLPGGNIRLEGRRDFLVQKETMTLKLSGLARPQDVGPDNVIQSDRLADVTVEVEGVGSISDVQNPGFLTRLFNIIF
jgi:flagellar L-ring protein precursor FlgH